MLKDGFYNLDCMQAMREMPDNFIDLAIVDPPYGIGYDSQVKKKAGQKYGVAAAAKKDYHASAWDDYIPDAEYFKELFRVSQNQIIWGALTFQDICRRQKGLLFGINDAAKK